MISDGRLPIAAVLARFGLCRNSFLLRLDGGIFVWLTGVGAFSSASEPVRSVGSERSPGSAAGATGPGSDGTGFGPWSCPCATDPSTTPRINAQDHQKSPAHGFDPLLGNGPGRRVGTPARQDLTVQAASRQGDCEHFPSVVGASQSADQEAGNPCRKLDNRSAKIAEGQFVRSITAAAADRAHTLLRRRVP